jgi:predicted nucleic acid-binding protein
VILVDSSVWIARLRGAQSAPVHKLAAVVAREPLLIGDLILLEVLQGARDQAHAARLEADLRQFAIASLLDPDLAVRAASNYRLLRGLGITVRKTVDLIIGTFCIEQGHVLLHDDHDFDPMERYLGLKTL